MPFVNPSFGDKSLDLVPRFSVLLSGVEASSGGVLEKASLADWGNKDSVGSDESFERMQVLNKCSNCVTQLKI